MLPVLSAMALTAMMAAGAVSLEPAPNPMAVGVDEAGSEKWIYDDPAAQDAFEQIGFDFVMHHFWGPPTIEDVERLDRWAEPRGHGFLLNPENSPSGREPGDPALYRRPGGFFQPPRGYVQRCLATPRFLGFCFDECEHWICNGIWVTAGRPFLPHFYDAEGGTLGEAYAGNLHNLQVLMGRVLPGFAERAHQPGRTPIVGTENVFPDLQHLFARAGLVQMPKLLKETITPVTLAMAMGAARQYGVQHWTSVDLWGMPGYPGHSPEELRSALLLSYWTGAERTYIENFSYQGSLYTVKDGRVELSPYGRVARDFIREYLPRHPRGLRFGEFAPEVIIVRFPDSDWGQENPGPWIRRNLYGAGNLVPDEDTRCWLRVWHVISHGTIPATALNYNTPLGIPYRVLFPANNVAVYDHTAADPRLYRSARLVFLVGKQVEPECLATLRALVEAGLTVVATRRLAPRELSGPGPEGYTVHRAGRGRWVITDDVTLPAVRRLLARYLGRPEELRYMFGATEVVFTTPGDPAEVQVAVRTRRAKRRSDEMTWQVGIGRRVITPETPVWLAGYGFKRVPDGKIHDLWVKVLALRDPSGQRVVLATTDHMGMSRTIYERLYAQVHARFGLARSEFMLTFSHNHCGPVLEDDLVDYYPLDDEQRRLVREYSAWMEGQVLDAIGEALGHLRPAHLYQGEGVCTFAVNRRENTEDEVPKRRAAGEPLKGVVDHYVPVLAVRGEGDELLAVLFGYACHPTTLAFNTWCGDYPGFAQVNLEAAHPGTAALFFNACGADQNPIPRRELELAEQYGKMLSDAVEAVLARPLQPVSAGLRSAFTFVDLEYEELVTRETLLPVAGGSSELHARWANRMLGLLREGVVFPTSYPYPVQAWQLGRELLLIGIGGEAVVDYSLRFRREFGPKTWVCGYANDMAAYIPSRRVWEEGGYEGGPHLDEYGRPAWRWAGDVEDRVAGAVHRVVAEVAG